MSTRRVLSSYRCLFPLFLDYLDFLERDYSLLFLILRLSFLELTGSISESLLCSMSLSWSFLLLFSGLAFFNFFVFLAFLDFLDFSDFLLRFFSLLDYTKLSSSSSDVSFFFPIPNQPIFQYFFFDFLFLNGHKGLKNSHK
jgi:hypothetical protein